MALWNLPGRSGQGTHPRFSDLIRNQLYRSAPNHDEFLDANISIDYENDPRPAAAAVIESLIEIRISSDTDQQKPCAVCRDSMRLDDIIKQLPCHHQYHTDCIVPWLSRRNTCPICRYELPTDDDGYDVSRQAIRRIEHSPERISSLSFIEEESDIADEISDLNDDSIFESGELLNGLEIHQEEGSTIYNVQAESEIRNSPNSVESDEEDDFRDDGAQTSDRPNFYPHVNMIPPIANPESEQYQWNSFDIVTIEVQDRINTQIAMLHSQISHLEQSLGRATSELEFERNRHDRLRSHLNDLELSLLKSDSFDRYLEVYESLHEGFRQFRQVLDQRFDQ